MMLRDLFIEYPDSLWTKNRRPARKWQTAEFIAALNNCDMVPAADPNTPSRMHRIMKAQALLLLAQASPSLYNMRALHIHVLKILGGPDPNIILNTPQQQQAIEQAQQQAGAQGKPPDPSKMAAVQAKAQADQMNHQQKQQEQAQRIQGDQQEDQARWAQMQQESADRSQDRQSRERIAAMREETVRAAEQAKLQHAALAAHVQVAQTQPQIIHVPVDGYPVQPHLPPQPPVQSPLQQQGIAPPNGPPRGMPIP